MPITSSSQTISVTYVLDVWTLDHPVHLLPLPISCASNNDKEAWTRKEGRDGGWRNRWKVRILMVVGALVSEASRCGGGNQQARAM